MLEGRYVISPPAFLYTGSFFTQLAHTHLHPTTLTISFSASLLQIDNDAKSLSHYAKRRTLSLSYPDIGTLCIFLSIAYTHPVSLAITYFSLSISLSSSVTVVITLSLILRLFTLHMNPLMLFPMSLLTLSKRIINAMLSSK